MGTSNFSDEFKRDAMKINGSANRQETGRWLNNRAENSHLPF